MVETFGTGKLSDAELTRLVDEEFDLRPGAIRRDLDLHRPIFQKTAAYGHFGRDGPRLHLGAHRPRRRAARGGRLAPRRKAERLLVSATADGSPGRLAPSAEPRVLAAPIAGRLVDLVDDVLGLGDAGEDEVVVVAGRGVEVDVADLHHPLVDATASS